MEINKQLIVTEKLKVAMVDGISCRDVAGTVFRARRQWDTCAVQKPEHSSTQEQFRVRCRMNFWIAS